MSTIYEALSKAQASLPSVSKSQTAKGNKFSYKYADLSDVVAIVRPILSEHGLFFFQGVYDGKLRTTICHSSGDTISDDGLPITQSNDPQAVGSAVTYMRRYGLCAMLGIVVDEDDDGAKARDSRPAKEPQADPEAEKARQVAIETYNEIKGLIAGATSTEAVDNVLSSRAADIASLPESGRASIDKIAGDRKAELMEKAA